MATHALMYLTDRNRVEAFLVGSFDELAKLYEKRVKDLGGFLMLGPPDPKLANFYQSGADGVHLVPLKDGWWDMYGIGREKLLETPNDHKG